MSNSGARGNYLLEGLRRLGSVALFLLQLLGQCVPVLGRPNLLLKQIYNAGARSLINEVIESNDHATRNDAQAMLSTLAPLS